MTLKTIFLSILASHFLNPSAAHSYSPIAPGLIHCSYCPPASTQMNQIVFTEPERTGFAPINLRSENFNFAPSWRAFQARLARSQGEQSLRGSLDWSVLEELNQEASRLWQEMLACENNDSEAARRNYYLANPCGGSRPDL